MFLLHGLAELRQGTGRGSSGTRIPPSIPTPLRRRGAGIPCHWRRAGRELGRILPFLSLPSIFERVFPTFQKFLAGPLYTPSAGAGGAQGAEQSRVPTPQVRGGDPGHPGLPGWRSS